jgi:hypothetical protein
MTALRLQLLCGIASMETNHDLELLMSLFPGFQQREKEA